MSTETATPPAQADPYLAVMAQVVGNKFDPQAHQSQSEQPPAQEQPPVQETAPPPVETAPPVVEAVDPLLAALTQGDQIPTWGDEAKNLFKTTFGVDDPLAYKTQVEEIRSKHTLLEQELTQSRGIAEALKRIEEQSPAMHAAILEELEGRSGLEYISKQGDVRIVGKQASELSDEVLMKTYLGDKFSEEEWNAYRTGDYTSVGVDEDTMKAKMKVLRPAAEHLHSQRNEQYANTIRSREQARLKIVEQDRNVRAQAIVAANEDPFTKPHITKEVIESFQNGTLFHGTFLSQEGTLHPNAIKAAVKAQRYDGDVKRALELGEQRGYQRGLQEGTAQMPNARPLSRAGNPPAQSEGDPWLATIGRALK